MSEEKVKYLVKSYRCPDETKREVSKTLRTYPGLNCIGDSFVFTNGMKKELISLRGTIPVPYRGKMYHIPVCIWLMDTHPQHAPIVFVVPTEDMAIKTSIFLDMNGKIYLPYLHSWNKNCSVIELIQIMITKFSECPPVYSKAKETRPQTAGPSPYPVQAYARSVAPPETQAYSGGSPVPSYPVRPAPSTPPYVAGAPLSAPPSYPPAPLNQNNAMVSAYPPQSLPYQLPPYTMSSVYSMPAPSLPPISNMAPSTSSFVAGSTGTITEEHIRLSLISAVEDKFRRKVNEESTRYREEIEVLLHTQNELNEGKNKILTTSEDMAREAESLERTLRELRKEEERLSVAIEKLTEKNDEPIDIDDIVAPTSPLHTQITNLHCEELGMEDTIYFMGEGLRKGVIDTDTFIKQVRRLSRERFMLLAHIEKCCAKAGIPPQFGGHSA